MEFRGESFQAGIKLTCCLKYFHGSYDSLDMSQIHVFRTNVKSRRDALFLEKKLNLSCNLIDVHFDLEDCDSVLRIDGINISEEAVMNLLTSGGFQCALLED